MTTAVLPSAAVAVLIATAESLNLGVTVAELLGSSRMGYLAHGRHLASFLLRVDLDLGWEEIAEIIHRDRSTALYGHGKIANRIDHDDRIRHELADIRSRAQAISGSEDFLA